MNILVRGQNLRTATVEFFDTFSCSNWTQVSSERAYGELIIILTEWFDESNVLHRLNSSNHKTRIKVISYGQFHHMMRSQKNINNYTLRSRKDIDNHMLRYHKTILTITCWDHKRILTITWWDHKRILTITCWYHKRTLTIIFWDHYRILTITCWDHKRY